MVGGVGGGLPLAAGHEDNGSAGCAEQRTGRAVCVGVEPRQPALFAGVHGGLYELCLLLQQAHYKDFARQLRTAFLTLSFSCTQGLSKLRRKVGEPFVLTPFRRAALIDCIALLQNAGGLPDVPRYLLNRLGEAESLLRLFLLEVPTRILYIDYDADGQPTFCAASSRVPQLLRSALWNTREPAILTSGTLAAAGDFSHTEQLLGLAAYRPLRHFRAGSPFNYKKKCLLYFPPRVKMQIVSIKQASEIMNLPPYYLRRVCRENPDLAFQSGVKWYSNLGKLAAYYNNKTEQSE